MVAQPHSIDLALPAHLQKDLDHAAAPGWLNRPLDQNWVLICRGVQIVYPRVRKDAQCAGSLQQSTADKDQQNQRLSGYLQA